MSRHLIMFPAIVGVAAASFMAMAEKGHLSTWKSWWTSLTQPAATRASGDRMKLKLLDQVNYVRIAAKHHPVKIDPELQGLLEAYQKTEMPENLDEVVDQVQNSIPRYYRVTVSSASRPSPTDLIHEFASFAQKTESEMTHFGFVVVPSSGGLTQRGLIVVGQRLDDFSPEILQSSQTDAFFNTCNHCGHPHICRVSNKQRSMTLACPSCTKTYAVVAADTHGRFRYVNEFLSGYKPPALFPKDQSRIQKLFTIWSAVHAHCTYKLDPETKRTQLDAWQTAVETQNIQAGDCEDSAIFLADWLGAEGFQVRVALGKYGDMGGHAWCVVRLDGADYLLESTEGRPDMNNPPLAEFIGSRYVPEALFDRKAIYARSKPNGVWTGDYWSAKIWLQVEPRNASQAGKTAANSTRTRFISLNSKETYRLFMEPERMAIAKAPTPALAPFADLNEIPQGSKWEKTIEDRFGMPQP